MAEEVLKGSQAPSDRLSIPELARRARLRRLIIAGVLLVAAAAGIAYYRRPQPAVERYRTEPVTRRTVVQLVESTGELDVRSRVEVPAPFPGTLLSIEVQEGDTVQAGALLATLDARSVELALRSAQATAEAATGRLSQAQAGLAEAEREREHAARLQQKGLASPQDIASADSARDRAKAAVAAARAEQKLAQQSIASAELGKSGSRISAPVGGVLLRVPDRIGAAVSPERGPLFVIGEPLEVMRLQAWVSESEILRIKPGSQAEVLVQELSLHARVEHVGIEPRRNGGVVQYPVTMLVDNPERQLRPGMTARVRVEVARATDALVVHEAALRFNPDGEEPGPARARVWRHGDRPNELEPVDVAVGVSDGIYAALSADTKLAAGDQLAVGLLRPGDLGKKPNVSLGGKQ